jgi:hypothetical protein
MTCSYNSYAERERVIVCVRCDHHQRLNSVDAAELLSEYGCQCVRCDGCTQRVSIFFWTPLYVYITHGIPVINVCHKPSSEMKCQLIQVCKVKGVHGTSTGLP